MSIVFSPQLKDDHQELFWAIAFLPFIYFFAIVMFLNPGPPHVPSIRFRWLTFFSLNLKVYALYFNGLSFLSHFFCCYPLKCSVPLHGFQASHGSNLFWFDCIIFWRAFYLIYSFSVLHHWSFFISSIMYPYWKWLLPPTLPPYFK